MDERKAAPAPPEADSQQAQPFFVDGHKVTVRYSGQENPTAIRAIRDALINSISPKKS